MSGNCNCNQPIDLNVGTIIITSVPTVVNPAGSLFAASGTLAPSASASPVLVGATAYPQSRPNLLYPATVNNGTWSIILSTPYTTFYLWAELQFQDTINTTSLLITDGTQTVVPPVAQSGDQSVEPTFKNDYTGWKDQFYYGGN